VVQRKVYPEVPPRVEYRLTPLGRSLEEPILGLGLWAERHSRELAAAGKRTARAHVARAAR
jgi:DNA-binding HxlR family transcriptional regulator